MFMQDVADTRVESHLSALRNTGGRIIGIDPGPSLAGFCELEGGAIGRHGWIPCRELLDRLRSGFTDDALAVVESPQAQDRPLGPDLRNTIWWAARFAEALDNRAVPWCEVEERSASLWLTGDRGTNPGVKMALRNHFGNDHWTACQCGTGSVSGTRGPKKCPACKGAKQIKVTGPLKGFTDHELSALAAALYVQQTQPRR